MLVLYNVTPCFSKGCKLYYPAPNDKMQDDRCVGKAPLGGTGLFHGNMDLSKVLGMGKLETS